MCTITVVFYNQENLVSFSYYTVGVHIYETHYYSCFYIQEKHLMHTYVYMIVPQLLAFHQSEASKSVGL